jgi:HK97 family phage major capsid protein
MAHTTQVQIKSETDNSLIVAGYGVVFGGEDLAGETFSADTDFMLELVPTKMALYDHRQNAVVKHAIGTIPNGNIKIDEVGLWIEAELDKSKAYVSAIRDLVKAGALGWSSGSVGHLVERSGKTIKQWPIVEFSLTPSPAEPRTLGVTEIRSLIHHAESLKALLPEAAQDTATQKATATAHSKLDKPIDPTTGKDFAMSNEVETATEPVEVKKAAAPAAPAFDIDAVMARMVDSAKKAVEESIKPLAARIAVIEAAPAAPEMIQTPTKAAAPAVLKTGLGDNEVKAYAHFLRTGDSRALGGAMKASNDTDMNVGTSADGGYAVPTGHYNGIIARLDEAALYGKLGVMQIPGSGTTVNVPLDAEADGEFVSTAEAAAFDRDAPALGTAAMTLVKYTKKVELSYELLQDEDSRLLAFLDDFVGRGMAKTHNSLLLTEALANGTAALTLDNAASVTAAEIPELQYKLAGEYDDGAQWIMRRAVEGQIRGLVGNNWQFAPTPAGQIAGVPTLFGRPVHNSAYMGAGTTATKSLLYGNFRYMGMRLAPDITVLRDPYSKAGNGQIVLHYYFRTVYKVLQAEAIVYSTQA